MISALLNNILLLCIFHFLCVRLLVIYHSHADYHATRMWANAQRDGRTAEYRWRPLFNAAKFG